MIKERIVLVLGAGASAPYGFPLGRSLMRQVISRLQGRGQFNELLTEMGFSEQQQLNFAQELQMAMQPSLDAFLENRWKDFLEIGKAALCAALLPYENEQDLMLADDEKADIRAGEQRWYTYLLNLLGNRSEFRGNRLSIITFNYDRSLEYFLFRALKPRFGIGDVEAIDMAATIPIVHVYGQLGKPAIYGGDGVEYGRVTVGTVTKAAKDITIIHEMMERAAPNLIRARGLVQSASLLVFLGFSYHPLNVERLMLKELYQEERLEKNSGRYIAGTCYGMQAGEINRTKSLFVAQGIGSTELHDCEVLDFLRKTNYLA